jgi:unsaturated rhamnogalacturonyl hydrolase
MLKTALEYAEESCDSLMKIYKPEELPPAGRLYYHQGIYLSGVWRYYELSGEKKYFDYVKAYVDSLISPDGTPPDFDLMKLDGIQPGILLFGLYKETGDERYKKALDFLINLLKTWKLTPDGGYWHTLNHANQIWLDGLYMSGPVSLRYASEFGQSGLIEKEINQVRIMKKHLLDTNTGLMYHAYDGNLSEPWADEKGRSPEFWGRAIGWYAAAVLDMLDYIPYENKIAEELKTDAAELILSLLKYQDKRSGMWYQVVNRIDDAENWHETSCTALFVYALSKAVRKGCIDKKYKEAMNFGYKGVINSVKYDETGLLTLRDICVGTNVGDLAFYLARPRRERDLHGIGIFILMCCEISRHETNKNPDR